ncbi:MAG: 23S rRNA (adenine(2503)-C(2))-methyltransferase RlmN [Bacteroidales bacterium]|nr:23S rRNA (adenine(2503)-C(2))-methyltransferase RlmN [Bacteroidales bacterium]
MKRAGVCEFFRIFALMKERLLGKTLEELKQAAVSCGLKPFVGAQLADWLYAKRATDWNRMVNISKAAKEALSEKYDLGTTQPVGSAVSTDGTKKYLFEVGKDNYVEAVMIPDEDRKTLCVSSQAGCKMGCKFCMTGRHGFHGQLDAADILNQFLSIDEASDLTNTVFMGMGEPLDNYDAVSKVIEVLTAPWGFAWSPKRITLSTIGVLPTLRRYLDEQRCHLAVSLHNPFPEERLEMMPAQKAWDIRQVIDLIRQYDFSGQRRVSFEYTMFAGFNDDKRHADALIRLLRGLECRVNLIRFHRIPDFPYDCASDAAMEVFRDRLNNHQILCTIRSSRGEDILAACGMLAGQHASAD